jgi:hypothetical protein
MSMQCRWRPPRGFNSHEIDYTTRAADFGMKNTSP